MKKIIWSDYAKVSFQETVDFIESQWGEELKEDVIELVDHRINQAATNPNIAPNLLNTPFKKLLIHQNLTIFYTLLPDAIKIILAWDNRQNPTKLLEKLTISLKSQ